ncbi:hydroxymyristoyl-ACP dehydratase [Muricauda sp. SCSIO 64092]|uniref:3-hydroxyacyl-ACP dehydratase FabZ family protein n=1 Tax=Allomuricauda sp. SCSIO 64092 TaxID=2908842 RepID=UPI001FF67917|nr:FabA/FabZ family ACP-dehydratase [Muricauda sp. SCSIO 64092]UOY06468.1 hydroxymyristoyl-ACP dehydratase [Muricauda sp. SCSIO 64092]
MTAEEIIGHLPYDYPFLFVDVLNKVDGAGCEGQYTFRSDLPFYQGHFKTLPVTPGVILTECCAQIGLVCLGIHLMGKELDTSVQIALSSTQMDFLLPVFPDETVTVFSEKIYFRFHKLKCKVSMRNSAGKMVCRGVLSGMFKIKAT